MTRQFNREFGILAIVAAATTWILTRIPVFTDASYLSWFSVLFFLSLTLIIQVLGQRAIKSSNINGLTQLILAMVMIKLVCCAALIVGYKSLFDPKNNLFVIPFLILYLLFTAYEVILFNRFNKASTVNRQP